MSILAAKYRVTTHSPCSIKLSRWMAGCLHDVQGGLSVGMSTQVCKPRVWCSRVEWNVMVATYRAPLITCAGACVPWAALPLLLCLTAQVTGAADLVQTRALNAAQSITSAATTDGQTADSREPDARDREFLLLPTEDARAAACDDLGPLFSNIAEELKHWKESGISKELQHAAIKHHTTRERYRPGVAVGFKNGAAYVVDKPTLHSGIGYHATIMLFYLRAMALLAKLFGQHIPDVEFVISSMDRPMTPPLHLTTNTTPEPVFRFSKTPAHSDIGIPCWHSYMKEYTAGLPHQVADINSAHPWHAKDGVLFGRFTQYLRGMHPADPYAYRVGAGGERICRNSSRSITCDVRGHFCAWAAKQKDMDVSTGARRPMFDHAAHKYLLHLDGQGVSSRFEQLLFLGSLVFKEQSGYTAYFSHLVEPRKHFIPFWKQGPEEILAELEWARSHDREAQRIAQAAQQLALTYLGPKGKACYWLKLLQQYAALLRYKPHKDASSEYSSYWKPVREYIKEDLLPFMITIKARELTFSA